MSSIKLKHSGGNAVSIAAPSSNPAADRTLLLPSDADSTIDTLSRDGNILQVKQTLKSTEFVTSSTSYTDITGFSIAITPIAASSKILLFNCAGISTTGQSSVIYMNLLRGSTAIAQPTASTSGTFDSTATIFPAIIQSMESWNFTFLDSPSYTLGDTITYKWQTKTNSTEFTMNNRDFDDMARTSTIIAMEVAA